MSRCGLSCRHTISCCFWDDDGYGGYTPAEATRVYSGCSTETVHNCVCVTDVALIVGIHTGVLIRLTANTKIFQGCRVKAPVSACCRQKFSPDRDRDLGSAWRSRSAMPARRFLFSSPCSSSFSSSSCPLLLLLLFFSILRNIRTFSTMRILIFIPINRERVCFLQALLYQNNTFVYLFLKTASHSISQAGLELMAILLSQSLEGWEYSHKPLHLALYGFFVIATIIAVLWLWFRLGFVFLLANCLSTQKCLLTCTKKQHVLHRRGISPAPGVLLMSPPMRPIASYIQNYLELSFLLECLPIAFT